MGKVFISYSRNDTVVVSALIRELERNKIEIWIDERNISVGSVWDESIAEAVDSSSHFLLVLSKESVRSTYVKDEYNYARRKHKTIIIIKIDDIDLPMSMGSIQHIDFRKNYNLGLERLIKILPKWEKTIPIQTGLLSNLDVSFPDNKVDTEKLQIVFPEDRHTPSNIVVTYPTLRFEAKGMATRHWQMRHAMISIGRSNICDITLSSTRVSRTHLSIFLHKGDYYVKDQGSSNGTWVNKYQLNHQEKKLTHGDYIDVAHTVLIRFVMSSTNIDNNATQLF